ncbi:hypothetical protein ABIF63_004872 [Bradyrhizobium japonicum]|uniref:Uncharacterized protein n=1 Tax=Bradyrhizobium japonicum TaxID=375 RepID=A0ABV2RV12_BRAJP|nr:hypothetical protein [Bradyrhizobium japonicum]UQD96017.1 hypothetical protein JEY30_31215 [Bradyrhizobium japonicum]WLB16154.1 hypothetical protein QIH95_29420 [Bradyrhizobium japonicum]
MLLGAMAAHGDPVATIAQEGKHRRQKSRQNRERESAMRYFGRGEERPGRGSTRLGRLALADFGERRPHPPFQGWGESKSGKCISAQKGRVGVIKVLISFVGVSSAGIAIFTRQKAKQIQGPAKYC